MKNLFISLKKEFEAGRDLVMATVVASSGSTPRGAGSRMLVGKEGLIAGTIGGGNVEYRSIQIARQILEEQKSREHFFELNRNDVSDLGMICGGNVNVFFHYLSCDDEAVMALVNRALGLWSQRKDFWLLTDLTGSGRLFIYESGGANGDLPPEIIPQLHGKAARITAPSYDLFAEQIGFSETVYIFGGGHVSQALVPALAAVSFKCVVLDDRPEFTDRSLFPGAEASLICDFKNILDTITVTENDLCCVLTRGHSFDTEVQAQLLKTPAYYIGVIGSRSKKAAVEKRLVEEFGIPAGSLPRITSPIGLNIKSETPAEIAVSITAQMIMERAKRRESLNS